MKYIKKLALLPKSSQNLLFYLFLCIFLYFARIILVFSLETLENIQIIGLIVLLLFYLISLYFLYVLLFRAKNLENYASKLAIFLISSLFAHFFSIFFVFRNNCRTLEIYEVFLVSSYCVRLLRNFKEKLAVLLAIYGFFVYELQLFRRENLGLSLMYTLLSILLVLHWFSASFSAKSAKTKENFLETSKKTPEIFLKDKPKALISSNFQQNRDNFSKLTSYPQRILDSIKEGIVVFDKNLKIRWKNRFLSKLFAVERDFLDTNANSEKIKEIVLNIEQDENYLKLQTNFLRSKKHFEKLFKAFQTKIEPLKNLCDFSGNDQLFVESSRNSFAESVVFKENLSISAVNSKNNEYFVNDNINLQKIHCTASPVPCKIKRLKDFLQEIFANSLNNSSDLMSSSQVLNFQHYNMYGVLENREENEKKMYFIRFFARNDEIVVMIKYMPENDLITAALEDSLNQSSLLASMCHELKTPLNYITNILELMKKDAQDKENPHINNEYISNALMNCKLLVSSVNDFLDFFSIHSDLFRLNLQNFDLKLLMSECFELFAFLAEKKHVHYEFSFEESINPWCFNDKSRLQQIILNLLNNAFKYTRNHGEIALQARNLAEFECIEIIVEDSGAGISSKTLRNLGNITSMSTNSEINGGLGICVSNYLVNYIGDVGKNANKNENEGFYRGLKIKTELGKGTRFSFIIPNGKNCETAINLNEKSIEIEDSCDIMQIQEEKENKLGEHVKVFPNNRSVFLDKIQKSCEITQKNCECALILGVDDNQYNLLILQQQFKKFHYKICVENSGVEAIEALENLLRNPQNNENNFCENCKFFQLILMDIEMPIKNGLETTKELRELFKQFKINCYIVGVSAFKQTEFRDKALEAGMDDYIEKPLKEENFKYLINKYLKKQ